MFDEKLFKKICYAECSDKELENFTRDIDKKEFDLDCPFGKYYNLERIVTVIEKYQNNQISNKYLAHWMNAYSWIIMGGFRVDDDNNHIDLKEFIMWLICDWLDSLSFFDWGGEYELEKYKDTFTTLNLIYRDCAKCDAMFAPYGNNDDDVCVLVVNEKSSYFVLLYDEIDYINNICDMRHSDVDSIKNEIERLNKIGYKRLAYGIYDYDDFE